MKSNVFFFTATYKGITTPISLDQNSNGNSAFQLPSGPESDSYQISLYVNVMDDSDGVTQYNVPMNAVVKPNNDLVNNLAKCFSKKYRDSKRRCKQSSLKKYFLKD